MSTNATPVSETPSNWQSHMDAAYSRWRAASDTSYADMLGACSPVERAAVLLGNLNYQVNNGGFMQWVDNGYALYIEEVMGLLKRIGTPNAALILAQLEGLKPHLNLRALARGYGGDYWRQAEESRGYYAHDDDEDEESEPQQEEDYSYLTEPMDDVYYALVNWEGDVEAWLAEGLPDRSATLPKAPAATVPPAPEGAPIRYPHVSVRLIGQDSNALNLIALVTAALRKHHVSTEEISRFSAEARSGNHDQLLQTCMRWVNVK